MNEGIIPPFSEEAERGCIGAALVNPDNLIECDLRPDDFFLGVHSAIWGAMLKAYNSKVAVDAVTVTDQLGQMGKLEEIGGSAKLVEFLTFHQASFNFAHYVSIVKRYAWKRRSLTEINRVAQAIFDDTCDEQKFGQVIERAADTMLTGQSKSGTKHFSEVLTKVYDEVVERSKNPVEVWGMETGLKDLDDLLGGMQLGETFEISGKPGVGKSKLGLSSAIGLAEHGYPGCIFSMEMLEASIGYRGLSAYAELPTRNLRQGKLDGDEWSTFTDAYGRMSQLPIYINDQPQTIQSLRADLAKHQKLYGVKWFVLDYLLLLDGYENLDETPRTTMLSRGIKHIVGMGQGLHGIVLNSVTKAGMDGQPKLADLRGSGQVIHDADLVAFVTENTIDPSILRLTFEKTRDVSNGKRTLEFRAYQGFPKVGNLKTNEVRHVDLSEL